MATDRPDHPVAPPFWYACEYPERPHDPRTAYLRSCPACCIAFEALARREPNRRVVLTDKAGHDDWFGAAFDARPFMVGHDD